MISIEDEVERLVLSFIRWQLAHGKDTPKAADMRDIMLAVKQKLEGGLYKDSDLYSGLLLIKDYLADHNALDDDYYRGEFVRDDLPLIKESKETDEFNKFFTLRDPSSSHDRVVADWSRAIISDDHDSVYVPLNGYVIMDDNSTGDAFGIYLDQMDARYEVVDYRPDLDDSDEGKWAVGNLLELTGSLPGQEEAHGRIYIDPDMSMVSEYPDQELADQIRDNEQDPLNNQLNKVFDGEKLAAYQNGVEDALGVYLEKRC